MDATIRKHDNQTGKDTVNVNFQTSAKGTNRYETYILNIDQDLGSGETDMSTLPTDASLPQFLNKPLVGMVESSVICLA